MSVQQRIDRAERQEGARANERWKGFEPTATRPKGGTPNRDGSVPTPRIAPSTPSQRERFAARESLRARFDSPTYRESRKTLERQIGATLDFADLPPDDQALKAGRAVVRLVSLGGPGIEMQGFATGFLVAPTLLVTNHHVFPDPRETQRVGAQFLYERVQNGTRQGVTFTLNADRFFLNNKQYDYALVAVEPSATNGVALDSFQYLPLIAEKGKIRKGDPVNIIQHPQGKAKRYATVNNRLLDLRDDGFLLYETDTLEGSSGSPVFNAHWEVIGLHHCAVPQMNGERLVLRDGREVSMDSDVEDDDIVWIANEGTRITALIDSLREQRMEKPEQQALLADLLARTKDPLRLVETLSPVPVAPVSAADTRGTSLLLPTDPMTPLHFNISGPTTIHVHVDAAPAPQAAVSAAPRVEPLSTPLPDDVSAFREKSLKFDENYDGREEWGYQADFLDGFNISPPVADDADLVLRDGKPLELKYYHYSLAMHRTRRLLVWAASNVDYSRAARRYTKARKEYGGENWRLDPRVDARIQLQDADFYGPATRIDRGHIVRREDSAWGRTVKEAEYGNSDTYHWTNCTPQSEAFNQSGKDGIWGKFETHVQSQAGGLAKRMSIFAGPVLSDDDEEYGYDEENMIKVPMEFWKIVLGVSDEGDGPTLMAYGLLFDQTEPVKRLGFERMDMEEYAIYQMSIPDIAKRTGLTFDAQIVKADVLKETGFNESVRGVNARRIQSLSDVVLR